LRNLPILRQEFLPETDFTCGQEEEKEPCPCIFANMSNLESAADLFVVKDGDPTLLNEDLAPTSVEKRTWGTYNYTALWIGMAHCIPTYMLASGLIALGMNWWQALFTVLLGNLIVLVPMLLNSYAGTRYGLPFPVICRASFGIRGSNIPAILRALVACGWFGIQTWIGGEALNSLLSASFPQWARFPEGPWVCFAVFWLCNMIIIWRGMSSVRYFEGWAAPFVLVATVALLIWAVVQAHGFGPILASPGKFNNFPDFWKVFVPSLTGMIGFWSTLSLNMPDFTRYAKGQKEQMLGQALGLPTTMTFFAGLGVMITSATTVIFGAPIWDPIQLLSKFHNPFVILLSLFSVAVATLSVNVAANVVSPAFDFSNLWPQKINFAIGGTITGIVGILMMPWKLLASYGTYITGWLVGYSAFLGPVAGIMIADFWVVRKKVLNVLHLYKKEGEYTFFKGFNLRGILALILGIVSALIGLWAPTLRFLYDYAWFVGFSVSFVAYVVLMYQKAEAIRLAWEKSSFYKIPEAIE
jgi:NCS1 family nucleobase:cation symporter-1